MTRFRAALTHLLISASLAAIVIGLIIFGWYPLPYFWALGGPMLLALLIGIDVVLGPLMTMILFNPKKSRRALTLDLTLIGIVQMSALIYGLHSGYVGRMAYGVFTGDQFHVVLAAELAPEFLNKAAPTYRDAPWIGQRMVGALAPDTQQVQGDLVFFKAFGVGIQHMPQYYQPLGAMTAQLKANALSRERLLKNHANLVAKIDDLLSQQHLTWQAIAVLPFDMRTATYTAIVNLSNANLIKVWRDDPLRTDYL